MEKEQFNLNKTSIKVKITILAAKALVTLGIFFLFYNHIVHGESTMFQDGWLITSILFLVVSFPIMIFLFELIKNLKDQIFISILLFIIPFVVIVVAFFGFRKVMEFTPTSYTDAVDIPVDVGENYDSITNLDYTIDDQHFQGFLVSYDNDYTLIDIANNKVTQINDDWFEAKDNEGVYHVKIIYYDGYLYFAKDVNYSLTDNDDNAISAYYTDIVKLSVDNPDTAVSKTRIGGRVVLYADDNGLMGFNDITSCLLSFDNDLNFTIVHNFSDQYLTRFNTSSFRDRIYKFFMMGDDLVIHSANGIDVYDSNYELKTTLDFDSSAVMNRLDDRLLVTDYDRNADVYNFHFYDNNYVKTKIYSFSSDNQENLVYYDDSLDNEIIFQFAESGMYIVNDSFKIIISPDDSPYYNLYLGDKTYYFLGARSEDNTGKYRGFALVDKDSYLYAKYLSPLKYSNIDPNNYIVPQFLSDLLAVTAFIAGYMVIGYYMRKYYFLEL